MQKLIILGMLISSTVFGADYSKCSQFLNPSMSYFEDSPSINPGVGMGGGLGMFGPLGYIPFQMDNNGKITPHDDVISYSQDDNGNESITFELPSYIPDNNPNKIGNPYKQKMRQVKVNIVRAENGEIQEIVYDESLTQAEIDSMQASAQAYYEQNTPEEIRKQNDQWARSAGQESYQPPFFAQKSKKLSFEIKNGQCVPMELTNESLIEPKVDGNTFASTQLKTQLCKDIKDFLNEHPEAAACLKTDLNKKMSDLFKSHLPEQTNGYGGYGYPGIGGGAPGIGMGYGGLGGFGMPMWGMGIESYLMSSQNPEWIPAEQRDAYFARVGSSPVITGNKLYQQCVDSGLSPLLDDESIWVNTVTNAQESAENSGEAHNAVEN